MTYLYTKDFQPYKVRHDDIHLEGQEINFLYKGNIRGVYALYNIEARKVYIGSSKNIVHRVREHYKALKEGVHYNPVLQEDANKYGVNSFVFALLETVKSNKPEDLISEENKYIAYYNTLDAQAGYNKVVAFSKNYAPSAEDIKTLNCNIKRFLAGKGFTLRSMISFVNKVSSYNPEVKSMCYQNISDKMRRGTIDALELENMLNSIGYTIEFTPLKT